MSNLDAWLAAMPPQSEIDQRIDQLHSELHKLELIKQLQQDRSEPAAQAPRANGQNGHGSSNERGSLFPALDAPDVPLARISPERREILELMVTLPRQQGTPDQVTRMLQGQGRDAQSRLIGMNMARMQKGGLLKRVRTGTYLVPPHVAALIRATAQPSRNGVLAA